LIPFFFQVHHLLQPATLGVKNKLVRRQGIEQLMGDVQAGLVRGHSLDGVMPLHLYRPTTSTAYAHIHGIIISIEVSSPIPIE
jgi:hypothetical protein